MNISASDRPALILIDIQKGFNDVPYWGGERNNPEAERHAAALLGFWREMGLPVFHIQHCSLNPASRLHDTHEGNAFQEIVQPAAGEPVIKKHVNSAFIGTDLKERLDRAGITRLVIAGLTTDHCVSTTTRMAGNYGYEVFLVADATATFCKRGLDGQVFPAELIHQTALASLHEEFAQVTTSEALMRAILED